MKKNLAALEYRQRSYIDYDHFEDVYTSFVEKKRQSILTDINKIDSQFMANLCEREKAGLPNKELPAKTQMELAVLETYYGYLSKDDAYQQKAFVLFLEKKMEAMKENGDDYSRIQNYLENKSRNASYEDYMDCISRPIDIRLPELWAEFFRSGEGYKDVIPKERPDVAYFSTDTDIPCFIFKKPYVQEYSEQEFCSRFVQEWDITHYNPLDDDDCDYDPARYADYADELGDRPQKAYYTYLCAVHRFKQIQQKLQNTDNGSEMEK